MTVYKPSGHGWSQGKGSYPSVAEGRKLGRNSYNRPLQAGREMADGVVAGGSQL